MQKILLFLLLITFMIPAPSLFSQDENQVKDFGQADSLSYGFGLLIGNNLFLQGVPDLNEEMFFQGFRDGFRQNDPTISIDEANNFIQNYFNMLSSRESEENLARGRAFLAENAETEGVVTLPSGLQYKVLQPGSGKSPTARDKVKVHYTGTLIDGSVFDSSIERGQPIEFRVDGVISGWTEALQLMKAGSKWMLYIPPDLGYGEAGAGGVIGPNETLIFEVELLEVIEQ